MRAENTREKAKMLKIMQQNQVLRYKLYKKGEILFICARCHTESTVLSAVREEEEVRRHKTILQKSDTKIIAASASWWKNADGKSHSSAKNSFEDKKSHLEQKQARSIKQSEA